MQSQSPIRNYKFDEQNNVEPFFDIENDIIEFIGTMIELDGLYSKNSAHIFGPTTHLVSPNYVAVSTHTETKFDVKISGAVYHSFTSVQGMPEWIDAGLEIGDNQKLFILSFANLQNAKAALTTLNKMKIWVYLYHELGENCIHHNPKNYQYEIRVDEYGYTKLKIAKKYFYDLIEYDSFIHFDDQSKHHLWIYKKTVIEKYPYNANDLLEKGIMNILASPFMSNYHKFKAIEEIAWGMLSLGDPKLRPSPEHDLEPMTDFSVQTMVFNFKKRLDWVYAKDNINEMDYGLAVLQPPELPFHPYANETTLGKSNSRLSSIFDRKSNPSQQLDEYKQKKFTPQ